MPLTPGSTGVSPATPTPTYQGPLLSPGGQGVTPPPAQDTHDTSVEFEDNVPGIQVPTSSNRIPNITGGPGAAPPGSLSKQQRKSVPIRIFNRKIFVTSAGQGGVNGNLYVTEPIKVEGYQRMDFAVTVHGMSHNTALVWGLEHAAVPETQHTSNWTTGGLSGTFGDSITSDPLVRGSTTQYTVTDFLPYLRMTIDMGVVASNQMPSGLQSQNMFVELSITGHLHEKKGNS